MNNIRINEYLEQAQKDRLVKQMTVSEGGILSSLSAKVGGWIQHILPIARPQTNRVITGEHKRATAEIPGV
jgi:hypothetical protein